MDIKNVWGNIKKWLKRFDRPAEAIINWLWANKLLLLPLLFVSILALNLLTLYFDLSEPNLKKIYVKSDEHIITFLGILSAATASYAVAYFAYQTRARADANLRSEEFPKISFTFEDLTLNLENIKKETENYRFILPEFVVKNASKYYFESIITISCFYKHGSEKIAIRTPDAGFRGVSRYDLEPLEPFRSEIRFNLNDLVDAIKRYMLGNKEKFSYKEKTKDHESLTEEILKHYCDIKNEDDTIQPDPIYISVNLNIKNPHAVIDRGYRPFNYEFYLSMRYKDNGEKNAILIKIIKGASRLRD